MIGGNLEAAPSLIEATSRFTPGLQGMLCFAVNSPFPPQWRLIRDSLEGAYDHFHV